jgi:hypothetical protein
MEPVPIEPKTPLESFRKLPQRDGKYIYPPPDQRRLEHDGVRVLDFVSVKYARGQHCMGQVLGIVALEDNKYRYIVRLHNGYDWMPDTQVWGSIAFRMDDLPNLVPSHHVRRNPLVVDLTYQSNGRVCVGPTDSIKEDLYVNRCTDTEMAELKLIQVHEEDHLTKGLRQFVEDAKDKIYFHKSVQVERPSMV